VLGKATRDEEVSEKLVEYPNPMYQRQDGSPATLRVSVFVVRIPVETGQPGAIDPLAIR
jgi:hypothetical protein